MKKWKKFIAMGLAVSMIVPSCIPQTLWASEFSAGSVESAADVFEDGAGYETGSESGNKISELHLQEHLDQQLPHINSDIKF